MLDFLPARRSVPSDGWAPDYLNRPQQKPRTQSGPLTAGQIEALRKLPVFAEMEARTLAAQRVIPRMEFGDLYVTETRQ